MRPAHADWLAAHVTPSTHSTCPAGRPRAAAATRRKVSGRPVTAGHSRRPAQHPPGPQAVLRREANLKPTVSSCDNFSQLTNAIICIFNDPGSTGRAVIRPARLGAAADAACGRPPPGRLRRSARRAPQKARRRRGWQHSGGPAPAPAATGPVPPSNLRRALIASRNIPPHVMTRTDSDTDRTRTDSEKD